MASFYGEITSVKDVSARLEVEFENSSSSGFTGRRYIALTVEDEDGDLIYDEKQYTGSNKSDGTITTWSISISGLKPDTTYDWYIYLGYKGTGDDSITWLPDTDDYGSFTTNQTTPEWPMPTCEAKVIGYDSIEFYIEGVEEAYDYWHYYGAFVYDAYGDQVIGPTWTAHDDDFFIKLTGLEPNTSYTAAIWVSERSDGEAPNARVILVEFRTQPQYIVEPSYDYISVTLQGGADLSETHPYFNMILYNSRGSTITSTGWYQYSNDVTLKFTDLSVDTEYVVEVKVAKTSSGSGSYSLGKTDVSTLAIPLPSFTIAAKTEKSVTVHITGVADAYSYWHYYRAEVTDTNDKVIASTSWSSHSSNFYLTLDGLASSTRYWVTVWISASSDGGSPTEVGSKRFDTPVLGLWSWDVSNGSASDAQTQTAYKILTGTLPLNAGFSYKVWNDFVDKTREMRKHFGDGTWDRDGGTFLSYEASHVESGDTLSALLYNSVKHQIGSIRATDILDVTRHKEKLTGYHIVHLTDVLNEIIEDL